MLLCSSDGDIAFCRFQMTCCCEHCTAASPVSPSHIACREPSLLWLLCPCRPHTVSPLHRRPRPLPWGVMWQASPVGPLHGANPPLQCCSAAPTSLQRTSGPPPAVPACAQDPRTLGCCCGCPPSANRLVGCHWSQQSACTARVPKHQRCNVCNFPHKSFLGAAPRDCTAAVGGQLTMNPAAPLMLPLTCIDPHCVRHLPALCSIEAVAASAS